MAKKKKKKSGNKGIIIALLIVLLLLSAEVGFLWINRPQPHSGPQTPSQMENRPSFPGFNRPEETSAPETETTEPETTEPPTTLPPEPEHVVATATIGATGDILMHMPVVTTGQQGNGTYNFDSIFRYLREYSDGADYAVANLETTLAGTGNGYQYSGYPMFNCPDEIVDGAKDAGFDMLLTANNHCFDTKMVGFNRTIEVIREKGLLNLGTLLSPEDDKYQIVEINGIKIGMMCFTYETGIPEGGYSGRVYLNGLAMDPGGEEIITSFLPSNPAPFYAEVQTYLDEMKEAGADATVMFIHWGEEYVLNTIPYQKTMAQELCNMGIDVIVGGHPHVVEPMELLESTTDPEHKTVCLYSMGNAVSNQRLGNISRLSTAHTEDGVWFTFTFSKYSDDTVYLESVDLIPCWVDYRNQTANRTYNIIPLDYDRLDEWKEVFELSDTGFSAAQRSYDRTMAIVGEGLTASQEYLAEQKEIREANYLAAVTDLIYAIPN